MDGIEACVPSVNATDAEALVFDQGGQGTGQHGLRVVVRGLSYKVQLKRGGEHVILHQASACFEPGRVAAVMGASGSGKTTLLDLLAGRKTAGLMSGLVLFDGQRPTRAFLRRHAGYVEQFDTLVDSLTVREMLLYTADLKRPMSEPAAAKHAAVDTLLKKLALTGCKDVRVGTALKRGISGGQAKRVNIGISLITNPTVLFLDEPTSGLDSATAYEVMSVVQELAKQDGTTICATIHSPSSATHALFDTCLLLAAGHTAFCGDPRAAAITFFTTHCGARQPQVGDNLAEWMMSILQAAEREGTLDKVCSAYAASDAGHRSLQLVEQLAAAAAPPGAPAAGATAWVPAGGAAGAQVGWRARLVGGRGYVTPPWWSLWVLVKYRTARNYRDGSFLAARLVDKVVFAVVVMLLYLGIGDSFEQRSIPSMCALMYLCIAQPAWGSVTYLPAIVLERALYVREHSDGLYRPLVYLTFKLIDELTINWLVGLGSCAIIFFGTQLQGSFIYFWLMLMTTLANGVVIAYGLAALCPTIDIANSAVPTLLAIMLFLSGFLIRVPDIPVYLRWLAYVNLLRYSWAGLMINQFAGHPEVAFGGSSILDYYGLSQIGKWEALGIVAAFFCCWSIIAWAALAIMRHHRR